MEIIIKGRVVLIDSIDYDFVASKSWTIEVAPNTFYVKNTKGRMHRLILDIRDECVSVDHINGNGLDNRRNNLRLCTTQQNNFNRAKKNNCTSRYKGVSWKSSRNKWQCQIKINYKVKYIGLFTSEIEAAKAYNSAASMHFGEFAKLNKIPLD